MIKDNILPILRISLGNKCNLNCEYCPPKGEDFFNSSGPISIEKMMEILEIFYKIGFRQFGFTGGEPLLNSNLPVILKYFSNFKDIYLRLYTNGTLIKDNIDIVKKFNLIKLSLDTIDREIYKRITGKDYLEEVLYSIKIIKKNKIKLRINTVLTITNYSDIFNLIEFCLENKINLKILDLNCFNHPGYFLWRKLYISPAEIIEYLKKRTFSKRVVYTQGKYGIPMDEFYKNGIYIRIKDTTKSSVYAKVCKTCRYFLCQEGIYHLTLTSDGKLKICKHRSDLSVDLNKLNYYRIEKSIIQFLNDNYLTAKRIFGVKQVFLGYFGI